MRKYYTIILFLALSVSVLHAQQNYADTLSFKQRLFFGGNVSLQLGNYTYVELTPLAGLHVTSFLDVGTGATYTYSHDSYSGFTNQIYGASVFTQLQLFNPIVAHVQGEIINSGVYNLAGDFNREWFQSLLVGGGLKQQVGKRSYSFLLILWNLNQQYNSPYQNPVIKVGFIF